MKEVRLGLVQMRCEKGAMGQNLEITRKQVQAGVVRQLDFLCLPEASITGYVDPLLYPDAVIRLDSAAVSEFLAMTAGSPMMVMAGIIESRPDGLPYITQIVAQDGHMLGYYRKVTIPDDEAHLFSTGHDAAVFAQQNLLFSPTICADIDNAALFTAHAKMGAELVFEMAAPGLYGEQATRDWQSGFEWWQAECFNKIAQYARDNRLCIGVATQAGRTVDEDFPGGGYLFGPDGTLLAATPDERPCTLYATLSGDDWTLKDMEISYEQ